MSSTSIGDSPQLVKELDLRKLFLTAFLVGIVAIVLAALLDHIFWMQYFGIVVPILCVVIYALVGSKQAGAGQTQSIDQVADSSYYLGFLFTLTSLISALVGVGADLGAGQQGILSVISNFALALSTTIVGLMSKILLTQFETTLHQQKTKSMGDLTKATSQFAIKLSNSTRKVDSYIDATNAKILSTNQEAVNALIEISKRHSEELVSSIEQLGIEKNAVLFSTIEHVKASTKKVQVTNASFDASLDKLIGGLDKSQEHISNSSSRFSEAILNTANSAGSFSSSVKEIGLSLQKQDSQIRSLLEKNAEHITSISNSILSLEGPDKHVENINTSTENMAKHFDKLQRSLERSSIAANAFADALPDTAKSSVIFTSLEESVDRHVVAVNSMEDTCVELKKILTTINSHLADLPGKRSGFFDRYKNQ